MRREQPVPASVSGESQPAKLTEIDVSLPTPTRNFGSSSRARLLNDTFVDDLGGEVIWQPDVYHEAAVLAGRLRIENLIDLGCGSGDKLVALTASSPLKVVGVDFNGSLAVARALHPDNEWIDANLLDPVATHALRDRLQDHLPAVIILSDVVEHLPDVRPILALVRDLIALNANSYVLISTPDRERQDYDDRAGVPHNLAHIREWSREELVSLVSNAGLEVSRSGWTRCNQWDEFFTTIFVQATYNAQRHLRRLRQTFGAPKDWAPEHLLITSELHGFTPSGGIGSFVIEQRNNYGEEKTLLLVASEGIIRGAERPIFALLPEELCSGADLASLPLEDRVLGAVEHALFLFPGIRTVEFQDYQGIGCRVAQAKRAGMIPPTVIVAVHCHGNTHYLENGRRDWLGRSHMVTSVREKISVENADVVCFPSRFLHDLYRDAGIEVDRLRCEFRRYPYAQSFVAAASTARIDTLVFFGKRTLMKGYKLFLDALATGGLDALQSGGLRRVVIIGPRTPETVAWDNAIAELKAVFAVEEHPDLIREEAIDCIREHAGRCLVVMPYVADNYPLSILDAMSAGALPVLVKAGGVPEMLPERFLSTLVAEPDSISLRSLLERLLSAAGSEIGRLRQQFADASNERQEAINVEAGSPFEATQDRTVVGPLTAAVVVPFFNTPIAQVALLLRSLLGQTRLPAEIIVVDDASHETAKVELGKLISRLGHVVTIRVLVHEVNQGLAAARNTALAATTADVLINVDSDDVVLNDFVASILRTLEANPDADAAVPYLTAFDDGADVVAGELNGYVYRPLGDGVIASQTDNLLGHANAGFRVRAIRDLGGWDTTARAMWEDYALYMRIVSGGGRVAVIPKAEVLYRVTPKSMARTYARWPAMRLLARNVIGLPRFEAFRLQAAEREREQIERASREAAQESVQLLGENRRLWAETTRLEALIAEEAGRADTRQRTYIDYLTQQAEFESEMSRLRDDNSRLTSEAARLQALVKETSDRLDAVWKTKVEYFEPELAIRDAKVRGLELALGEARARPLSVPRTPFLRRLLASRSVRRRIAADTQREEDRRLIVASGLFDPVWYLQSNPDLEGVDLLDHYLRHGGCEGRSPSLVFDGGWYLSQYPDVGQRGANPLVHYLRHGADEGRLTGPSSPARQDNAEPPDAEDDSELIAASGLFDPIWYLERNPDLKSMDLLDHYLRHGGREGRAPSPHFDGGWYLHHYPDIAEAGYNPLVHYIKHGEREGRLGGPPHYIVETLRAAMPSLTTAEPEIGRERLAEQLPRLPLNISVLPTRLNRVWKQLFDGLDQTYDRIVFTPWLLRGGADLVAANAARSVVEAHGDRSVLMVVTDHDRVEARDWIPAGADLVVLSDHGPELTHEERTRVVEMLIFAIRPRVVLNVNSRACWEAIARRGAALATVSGLYANLFCRDYDETGQPGGYADTHMRVSLPHLTKLYVDNLTFIDELASDFQIPSSLKAKMQFLPQPISRSIECRSGRTDGGQKRLRVMWTGRFTRQKNVNLLAAVVRRAPDIQFNVFGYGDNTETKRLEALEHEVSNLSLKGAFASLAELPVEHYSAYLFTSLWEGLPTTLIDVAALGVPIVASDVGGVGELVNDETGWLVRAIDDPDAYISALTEIHERPDEVSRRLDAMSDHVRTRHSWTAYTEAFRAPPSFLA